MDRQLTKSIKNHQKKH